MSSEVEEICEGVRRAAGDSVRTVAHFAASGSDVHYRRTDLSGTAEHVDFEAIGDDLVLEALGRPHQEALYDLGDLQATVRVFDFGTVVVVPVSPSQGYAAILDASCPLPARDIVDRIRNPRRTRLATA